MSHQRTSQLDWLLGFGDDGKKQWPDMSQMTCSSSLVWHRASQGDSSAYLACVTQWQLTSICCKALYMTDKGCWTGGGGTLGQRQTGGVYLCEPVSVGGSWGVAEQRKKHRMCTGLRRPTPGTFQTLHLQKKNRGKQVHERCVLIAESEKHTWERCFVPS